MKVLINGKECELPSDVKSVKDLAEARNIPAGGTAIAINSSIVKKEAWAATFLNENDNIIIISGTYGG